MFKSGGPRECLLLFDDPKAATLASFLDETEFADRKIKVRLKTHSAAVAGHAPNVGLVALHACASSQVSLTDEKLPEDPLLLPVAGLTLPGVGAVGAVYPYGAAAPGLAAVPGAVPGLMLPAGAAAGVGGVQTGCTDRADGWADKRRRLN